MISGTGFLEASGNSILEINAATAQEVRVLVNPGATASIVFDQPAAFTGSLNLINPNSSVDLFFKGETPTAVTFSADAHTLIVTGAGGTVLNSIPFTSNGVVPLSVIPSTRAGYGEVVLGTGSPTPTPVPTPLPTPVPTPTPTPTPPGNVALHGSHDQYVIISNNGSLEVDDKVGGRDGNETLPANNVIKFTDGTGVFDPTGTAEDVDRLYSAALGRAPDVAGLQFWTNAVDGSHVPLSDVANTFASSPEFIHSFGSLSDAAFVQQLYQNVLGRPGDAAGAAFWQGTLATGSTRGSVVLGFAQSPENQAKTLSTAGDKDNAEAFRLYQAALDRAPDDAGQTFWSNALRNGATPAQLAQGFINSPEFQQKYGSLGASDFVAQLYENVLHRPGDAAGQQFWTNSLQQGASQASVLVGFSDSAENRMQTAAATHANWVFIPA